MDVAPDPYGGFIQDGELLEQVAAGGTTSFQIGVALRNTPTSGSYTAQIALWSNPSAILASVPVTVVVPPFSFSCDPPATIASGPAPIGVPCTVTSTSPVPVTVGAVGAAPGNPEPGNGGLTPSSFAPTPEGQSGLVAAIAPATPGPWVFQFTAYRWSIDEIEDVTVTAS
ncbi:MAG TPA: hypothetical protein VKY26_01360 [Actinomycetota bacterium]|nr:hypothetical protein [Actinomycetota bacterium]